MMLLVLMACVIVWQTFPFFGIVPTLMSEEGNIIEGEGEGYLVRTQNTVGGEVQARGFILKSQGILATQNTEDFSSGAISSNPAAFCM